MSAANLDSIREQAKQHATQIEAVHWLGVADLAARWNISERAVRKIPRDQLPYIPFGGTLIRRYDPADVERFEAMAKRGEAA